MSQQTYQPDSLPFGGLGFDLRLVQAAAEGIRLMPVSVLPGAQTIPETHAAPLPHGYGLLLWLNRETGGS